MSTQSINKTQNFFTRFFNQYEKREDFASQQSLLASILNAETPSAVLDNAESAGITVFRTDDGFAPYYKSLKKGSLLFWEKLAEGVIGMVTKAPTSAKDKARIVFFSDSPFVLEKSAAELMNLGQQMGLAPGLELKGGIKIDEVMEMKPLEGGEILNLLPEQGSAYFKIAERIKEFNDFKEKFKENIKYNFVFLESNLEGTMENITFNLSLQKLKYYIGLSEQERSLATNIPGIKFLISNGVENEKPLLAFMDKTAQLGKELFVIILIKGVISSINYKLNNPQSVIDRGVYDEIETYIHEPYCHVYLELKFGSKSKYVNGNDHGDSHRYYYASQAEIKDPQNPQFIMENYDLAGYPLNTQTQKRDFPSASDDSIYQGIIRQIEIIVNDYRTNPSNY